MTRAEIRENTFKLLFCKEFHDEKDMEEQYSLFFDGETSEKNSINSSEEDVAYISNRVNSIIEKTAEIDEMINDVAVGWKTGRMGKVELNILRLAVFEMKYDDEIPAKVAVDQAVILAKKYGTDAAPKFVNGILAKLFTDKEQD